MKRKRAKAFSKKVVAAGERQDSLVDEHGDSGLLIRKTEDLREELCERDVR